MLRGHRGLHHVVVATASIQRRVPSYGLHCGEVGRAPTQVGACGQSAGGPDVHLRGESAGECGLLLPCNGGEQGGRKPTPGERGALQAQESVR